MKRPEPEGFPEFWAIWLPIKNRNDGRNYARVTFAKWVKAGIDPQDIIDGVRFYTRNLPVDHKYKLHASTWLNRGVWEDDCIKERKFQAMLAERAGNVVEMKRA